MTVELVQMIAIDRGPNDVALLGEQRRTHQLGHAQSSQSNDPGLTIGFEFHQWPTRPRGGDDALDETHPCAGVHPFDPIGIGLDATKHPFDRPLDGGDGRDAESFVDRGAALIVDTCHDSFDMEELACRSRDQDVGVVAIRDCRQCIGSLNTCGTKSRSIESDTDDRVTTEVLRQTTERRGLSIDDRHGVSLLDQCGSET